MKGLFPKRPFFFVVPSFGRLPPLGSGKLPSPVLTASPCDFPFSRRQTGLFFLPVLRPTRSRHGKVQSEYIPLPSSFFFFRFSFPPTGKRLRGDRWLSLTGRPLKKLRRFLFSMFSFFSGRNSSPPPPTLPLVSPGGVPKELKSPPPPHNTLSLRSQDSSPPVG